MAEANGGMDCQECGQNVEVGGRHTFLDCAIYISRHHKTIDEKYASALLARIEKLENGLRNIEAEKLREIAEWFDTVDGLLDVLTFNGTALREQFEMPRKSEIQQDVRRWADTVEALG